MPLSLSPLSSNHQQWNSVLIIIYLQKTIKNSDNKLLSSFQNAAVFFVSFITGRKGGCNAIYNGHVYNLTERKVQE